ncbi:MAG: entericidin A/B family lipoprotein [Burkholderiales bacterium]|jgi:predicted small secreted protein|nr:entericidin A/B family lipoprotein [Burkholderiales bacterium]
MKTALLITSLFAAVCVLSACNTMQGLGKDVERAGEKVQEIAKPSEKKKN